VTHPFDINLDFTWEPNPKMEEAISTYPGYRSMSAM
jgi:hypothetical protein